MERWYIAHCQSKCLKGLLSQVSILSTETYLPVENRITRRKDCGGSRLSQKPLFPGYLFVRFDPEITNPGKFTDIPGIFSFLSVGERLCVIGDDVINALRCVRILRLEPSDTRVQCVNLSPGLISKIQRIYTISEPLERKVEFMRLLQRDDVFSELLSNASHIYAVVDGKSL